MRLSGSADKINMIFNWTRGLIIVNNVITTFWLSVDNMLML